MPASPDTLVIGARVVLDCDDNDCLTRTHTGTISSVYPVTPTLTIANFTDQNGVNFNATNYELTVVTP